MLREHFAGRTFRFLQGKQSSRLTISVHHYQKKFRYVILLSWFSKWLVILGLIRIQGYLPALTRIGFHTTITFLVFEQLRIRFGRTTVERN